jgi:NAD dependent epimerase/dehydratase
VDKKVLVTGASGFIGSHLTEALVTAGYEVRAFVRYASSNSWGWLDRSDADLIGKVDVFRGDIKDPYCVRQAMQGMNAVLHLAALIAIPYSYTAPVSYVDTNIYGTLNVLQAARDFGVERVVHTSTSEVYGTAQFVPITELHPLQGQSPYSATKIAADQLALSYCSSFDMPVTVIRPFNTYGPRQSARAVIPTVITQIANGARKVQLGLAYPTRDFNFVSDTVAGFIAALEAPPSVHGQVINLASNFEISIEETAQLIAEQMGVEIEVVQDANRLRPVTSEVERLYGDNTKARDLLGWTPKYGGRDGFMRGLRKTITWFSDPENLKSYRHDIYNL